jgi:hypothetical protein
MTAQATSVARSGQPCPAAAPRPDGWAWILAWLAFLPVAVLRAGRLAEGDTFWEIRTGLLTIGQRAIPAVDPFSWTVHGRPWTLNSWGFNVVIGLAYKLAGLPGVAWACAGMVMALAALVLLLARQMGASPPVAGALLLLATGVLVVYLSARPQLVDYLAVVVLVMLLRRIATGAGRAGSAGAAGLLSVVWVNLHAGALLGAALAGACAALLLARRATRGSGWWCLAAAGAALAGAFASPYGTHVIGQAEHVQSASAGLIVEWRHFDPASPLQWLALATGVAALAVAVRRRDPVFTAALSVAVAGSVWALRFQPFAVLLALPLLAAALSSPPAAVAAYARSRRVMLYRGAAAGAAALIVLAALSLPHIGRPDPATYPVSLAKDIPRGCHLFSTDLIGSFVILARPDVAVAWDTRDDLYGRQRVLADERVLAGRGPLAAELAGAGCVLVPPGFPLAARLRADPAWRAVAADGAAVLFTRR